MWKGPDRTILKTCSYFLFPLWRLRPGDDLDPLQRPQAPLSSRAAHIAVGNLLYVAHTLYIPHRHHLGHQNTRSHGAEKRWLGNMACVGRISLWIYLLGLPVLFEPILKKKEKLWILHCHKQPECCMLSITNFVFFSYFWFSIISVPLFSPTSDV